MVVLVALARSRVYSLSGRAASTGRRIRCLNTKSTASACRSRIPTLFGSGFSARSLYERLNSLEMAEYDPINALYVKVPGYEAKPRSFCSPSVQSGNQNSHPGVHQLLLDWLRAVAKNRARMEANP